MFGITPDILSNFSSVSLIWEYIFFVTLHTEKTEV
jgi:hypothetical protein